MIYGTKNHMQSAMSKENGNTIICNAPRLQILLLEYRLFERRKSDGGRRLVYGKGIVSQK